MSLDLWLSAVDDDGARDGDGQRDRYYQRIHHPDSDGNFFFMISSIVDLAET